MRKQTIIKIYAGTNVFKEIVDIPDCLSYKQGLVKVLSYTAIILDQIFDSDLDSGLRIEVWGEYEKEVSQLLDGLFKAIADLIKGKTSIEINSKIVKSLKEYDKIKETIRDFKD